MYVGETLLLTPGRDLVRAGTHPCIVGNEIRSCRKTSTRRRGIELAGLEHEHPDLSNGWNAGTELRTLGRK